MPRTAVIEIAILNRVPSVRLWKSTDAIRGSQTYVPFALDAAVLPKLDTAANVDAYAAKIYDALCAHPEIGTELTQIAVTTTANGGATLRFALAEFGENYRWEVLKVPSQPGFLALNGACTVSRFVQSGRSTNLGPQAVGLPITMAAFLSAANETANRELDTICHTVLAAQNKGVDVKCRIYLGEQTLLDETLEKIAEGQLPGIAVHPMPSSTLDIEKTLKDNPVQILHFYCHGLLQLDEWLLELATIGDWEKSDGPVTGSVTLSVDRLRQTLLSKGSTWITVLNCCSGAASVDQLHSMSLMLAQQASPFVVGMAEPIAAKDATLFASRFYEPLFQIVKVGIDELAAGKRVVLNLAPAVAPAREALHQQYRSTPADAFGRWCLPIMYERDEPLELVALPTGSVVANAEEEIANSEEAMHIRISLISGALRSLPATTPVEVRTTILAILDEPPAVPAARRPDAYGRLA